MCAEEEGPSTEARVRKTTNVEIATEEEEGEEEKEEAILRNIVFLMLFVMMGCFVFVCIEVVLLCSGEKGKVDLLCVL